MVRREDLRGLGYLLKSCSFIHFLIVSVTLAGSHSESVFLVGDIGDNFDGVVLDISGSFRSW